MTKNKKLMFILILILGIVIGIFMTHLYYRMKSKNKTPLTKVMEGNDTYHQVLNQQAASQKETSEEIPTEALQYEEKVVAYTYYDEKEKQCYTTLDFFFSDAERFHNKSEFFLKFDERMQWTTDKTTAELWVFKDDGYICKNELPFINAGFHSAEIDFQDLNKTDFPLHIQVNLITTWTEDEIPEKIIFEYGLW